MHQGNKEAGAKTRNLAQIYPCLLNGLQKLSPTQVRRNTAKKKCFRDLCTNVYQSVRFLELRKIICYILLTPEGKYSLDWHLR